MNCQILVLLLLCTTSYCQKIVYLNGLYENEICGDANKSVSGICKKISECFEEFDAYKKNQKVLRICSYGSDPSNTIICCPNQMIPVKSYSNKVENSNNSYYLDLTNFETCRDEFLKFRKMHWSIHHFVQAFIDKKIPQNKENCDFIEEGFEKLVKAEEGFLSDSHYGCKLIDGKYGTVHIAPYFAELVRKGDRPNIAAIGWTNRDGEILYNCGGSLITEKFVVTAAHCKYFYGKTPDFVRFGDRYLLTEDDDDIAQQANVEKFISHPNYNSFYHYDDIALIKTVTSIIFNKFVVPSCIADLDAESAIYLTVAGYGETEDLVQSNILLELKVELISNEECDDIFSDNPSLPKGILESQLCVQSIGNVSTSQYSDTCFGDSGSPLQYKTSYEVFPKDFNKTLISHFYQTSNVIGIVSFGSDCGLNFPSVYTKLSYYRDWMRSVIHNN